MQVAGEPTDMQQVGVGGHIVGGITEPLECPASRPIYRVPVSANIAPSGSMPFTIQPPPGTSIGPWTTWPPA